MNSKHLFLAIVLLVVVLVIRSTHGALLCELGYQPCGTQCYKPATGDQCFNNGLICGLGYQPCGTQCYRPASGQQCFE
ncbi:unnamed protein product [Rotaria socialis]|uniref:Uncharacterized protein n=1 Tax=Rotaria socialis TaxID=392032 RepID=A0A821BX17_9BILA|nr:unnamed protein product [Rotaria socialis]